MTEEVLVCRRELFVGVPEWGLLMDVALLEGILAQAEFMDRGRAERDPTYKQIIPYAVLRHGDDVFRYRRTQQGKEGRLRGRYSIGVGGHINRADIMPLWTETIPIVEWARDRELREEFHVGGVEAVRMVGLLNDERDEVGRVHFGVVYEYRLAAPDVTPNEAGRHDACEFVTAADLRAQGAAYETWSQILIEQYL